MGRTQRTTSMSEASYVPQGISLVKSPRMREIRRKNQESRRCKARALHACLSVLQQHRSIAPKNSISLKGIQRFLQVFNSNHLNAGFLFARRVGNRHYRFFKAVFGSFAQPLLATRNRADFSG